MIEFQSENMFAKDMMEKCLQDLHTQTLEQSLAD